MKILIAEDEKKLASFMAKGLQQAGHLVQQCHSGSEALEKAAGEDFDLILLDLMLPGTNGFEVLKNLRAFKIVMPVMIVSALGNTEQVVEGLDLGAVDYIKKPFEWNELLARIRAVQRKTANSEASKLVIDDLVIDIAARKVSREGKDISLTAKEFLLLQYLAKNLNRVVTRMQLLENVWEMDFDPESNIVDVYLYQLRKKLDKGFTEPMIETVVGAGGTASTANAAHSYAAAGRYTVSLIIRSLAGCADTVSTALTVFPRVAAAFAADNGCMDVPVVFKNNSSANAGYQWLFGDGTGSSLANPFKTYGNPGTYAVQLVVTSPGCEKYPDTARQSLRISRPEAGIRYPAVNAIVNKPQPLQARSFGRSYAWQPATFLSRSDAASTVFTGNRRQDYLVRITAGNGCQTTDTVPVNVYNTGGLYVPTAFMGGYWERRLDMTGLSFSNQFNGDGFNPAIASGEIVAAGRRSNWDVQAGLQYTYMAEDDMAYVGFSVFHLGQPKNNFLSYSGNDVFITARRCNLSAGFNRPAGNGLRYAGSLLLMQQGQAREMAGGGAVGIPFSADANMLLYLGAWARWNDAIIPTCNLQWGTVNLGLSYDVSYGSKTFTKPRSFELSLVWIRPAAYKSRTTCFAF